MKTYSANLDGLAERNGCSVSSSGSSPLETVEMGPSALISTDKDQLKDPGLVWSPYHGVDSLNDGGNVELSVSNTKSRGSTPSVSDLTKRVRGDAGTSG